MYVDDLVSGAHKDDQAFEIYQNTKRVMSDGGFKLRKWCSNSASLVEAINKAETTFEPTQKNHSPAVTDESPSYAPKFSEASGTWIQTSFSSTFRAS